MDHNSIADVTRAAHFAAQAHAGQKRKGAAKEPYINHLIEVADLLALATSGTDPALVMAGLLHDTVEDTSVTPADLEREFGADVARLVAEVTDDKSLPKAERKEKQIEHAAHASDRAKRLKMADKISNLRAIVSSPPADWSTERKQEYFRWGARVVAGCRGVSPELEQIFDQTYEKGMRALS